MTGLLVTLVAGRALLRCEPAAPPDRTPEEDGTPRRPDRRTRRLVVTFGLIALCTAYGEGAMADWGACTWSRISTPPRVWRQRVTRASPSP